MTGPALTREECQRLAGLVRLGLKAGLFGVQYEDFLKIADLVEVYPIVEPWSAIGPTGEREEISRAIEGEKWAGPPYDHPGLGLADDAEAALGMALDEAEGDGNLDQIVEWLRDAQATVAALAEKARRTAALLRQPPPPPAAGASKEAVTAAVRAAFEEILPTKGLADSLLRMALAKILRAVEALPEAAPQVPARTESRDVCPGCVGDGEVFVGSAVPDDEGYEPCPVCGGGRFLPTPEQIAALRSERDQLRGDLAVAEAEAEQWKERVAAPPAGVDREAVLAILRHAALELSPDMTEAATIADCIVLIRDLPEAKP